MTPQEEANRRRSEKMKGNRNGLSQERQQEISDIIRKKVPALSTKKLGELVNELNEVFYFKKRNR